MKPTICVECVHHINTHDGSRAGPPPDTWFYQQCGCQAVEIQPPFDYVLGVQPRAVAPYCRDVNKGACKHWEQLP